VVEALKLLSEPVKHRADTDTQSPAALFNVAVKGCTVHRRD
jgi:hypothetical protein